MVFRKFFCEIFIFFLKFFGRFSPNQRIIQTFFRKTFLYLPPCLISVPNMLCKMLYLILQTAQIKNTFPGDRKGIPLFKFVIALAIMRSAWSFSSRLPFCSRANRTGARRCKKLAGTKNEVPMSAICIQKYSPRGRRTLLTHITGVPSIASFCPPHVLLCYEGDTSA